MESLFTRIPLQPLIDLLHKHLHTICNSHLETETVFELLVPLIKYNTFNANGKFYLQKTGLPMGGCLSSSLANIYLGYLEESLLSQHTSSILLYTRYVDDILIIVDDNQLQLDTFITSLKQTFKLSLTTSSSPSNVTFLDTRVHFNARQFHLSFYSKTPSLFLPNPTRGPSHNNECRMSSLVNADQRYVVTPLLNRP